MLPVYKRTLAVAFVLAATVGTAYADGPKFAVMFFDSQGFYGGIQKGITEGSKGAGAELILSNSKLDAAAEAAFIDSAIASGVDGLIVSPVSEAASVVALERAHEAGIPIICYNTCLGADDTKRLVAGFVTTDQYDFGHQLGKSAAAYVKANTIDLKLGILNCDVAEACKQRKAGFLAALSEGLGGTVTPVADQEGYITDKATQTTTEMLTANPQINLIYTANEGGTGGAVLGVDAAGKTGSTVVFGSDADTQILEMLKSAEVLKGIIAQDPQQMGRRAVELALAAASRTPTAETSVLIPSRVYLSDDTAGIEEWLTVHADGIP